MILICKSRRGDSAKKNTIYVSLQGGSVLKPTRRGDAIDMHYLVSRIDERVRSVVKPTRRRHAVPFLPNCDRLVSTTELFFTNTPGVAAIRNTFGEQAAQFIIAATLGVVVIAA